MPSRPHYVPRNYRWFNRLLRYTYGLWLRIFFRVGGENAELAKSLKPPFVIVSNHVTILDPFILSCFLREPVYWITSDGNMRTRLMRALLRLVGSIPKSKVIPDIETVGWSVDVIRKRGGVVGIFPEGQQSWDGTTLPLIPSTAKLLKLLKVPVLAAVIKGGYSSLPRWSWARRRGRIEVQFKLAFEPEELASLPVEAVRAKLNAAIWHDETEWQERKRVPFVALRRAEHAELPLFLCPRCEAIGSIHSSRARLACLSCGLSLRYDLYGRLRVRPGESPVFSSLRDWIRWQAVAFEGLIARASAKEDRPIFSDSGAILLRGRKMNPLRRLRSGTLILFPDRLELATFFGDRLRFPIHSIEGPSVLKRNILEFYVGRDLYQVRFPRRSTSALKWQLALESLSRTLSRPAIV
jgi:1-acyl-sn-glycerol-3-phosphate acyltransferase